MKIIITMSGEGTRFKDIGFSIPKHEIIAKDKTLFEWSMLSLEDFFDEDFIFVVRRGNYDENFIEEKNKRLGIRNYSIIEVNYLTEGQASTAMLADDLIKKEDSVVIYNIDTYINEGTIKKRNIKIDMDGYIPSFEADGEQWSFVKIDENLKVNRVSEKVRISNLGTIGFYYFKRWNDFKKIYNKYKEEIISKYNETYIAPIYQYMIDSGQNIYTDMIKNKHLHVLGTPEDIEYFDYDYLKRQEDEGPHLDDLRNRMQFKKLEKSYRKAILKNERYIFNYVVFLADIGYLEELEQLFTQHNIEELFKQNNYKESIGNSKYLYDTYKTGSIFRGIEEQKSFLIIKNNPIKIIEIFNSIVKSDINLATGDIAMLLTYVINKLCETKQLNENLMDNLFDYMVKSRKFNELRIKYIVYKIFNYFEKYDDTFFVQKGRFSYLQKFLYLLNGRGKQHYYKGVRYYLNKFYSLQNTDITFENKVIIEKTKKIKNNPRIALAISGATRLDVEKQLMELKNKVIDPLSCDVFIHSWRKHQVYMGLGTNVYDSAEWLNTGFPNFTKFAPKSIKTVKAFKSTLPRTYKLFEEPIEFENIETNYTNIFPNAKVILEDENIITENYNNDNFIRRGVLNQAKMFYSLYKSHQLIKESNTQYDYIIKSRIDFPPREKIKLEDITSIKSDEIAVPIIHAAGTDDILYWGEYESMMKVANAWEYARKANTLSPFTFKGTYTHHDSHMIMNSLFTVYKIKANTTKFLRPIREAKVVPYFEDVLQEDVKNLDNKDREDILNFFDTYLKKYQYKH